MADHVFLKGIPKRGVVRFGKREKLASRYIGPFEVLERVGTVSYRLALPLSLSGVNEVFHVSMLQKYTPDPAHVVDWERLLLILMGPSRRDQCISWIAGIRFFDARPCGLVKVLWQHRGVEEAMWEHEDTMRATYPFLFEDEDV